MMVTLWCWWNTMNSRVFHYLMHQRAGHCEPLLNSWLVLNFHSSHLLRLSRSNVNKRVTDGRATQRNAPCHVSAFLPVGHECLCCTWNARRQMGWWSTADELRVKRGGRSDGVCSGACEWSRERQTTCLELVQAELFYFPLSGATFVWNMH